MMNIWQKLPRPFFALATMDDVTDTAFRQLVAEQLPAPDLVFTEFANADGLQSPGRGTVIVGNGDVDNRHYGEVLAAQTGVDGMIGRGIFRDPWMVTV